MPRYSSFDLHHGDTSSFNLEITDLLQKHASEPARTDRPSRLPIADIKLAFAVFQPRSSWLDLLQRDQHIRNIVHFLHLSPTNETEPLTVTIIGSEFYLIDGHHRLAAYREASQPTRTLVPVVYFEGDVIAAKKEALRLNSTGKLSLLDTERFDNAFELIKLDATEDEVLKLTQVSRPTYYNMKKKLSDFPEIADKPWSTVRGYQGAGKDRQAPPEDYENPKSHEIEGFLRTILPTSSKAIPILATALSNLSPNLPSELIQYWLSPDSPGFDKRHRRLMSYVYKPEEEDEV